MPTLSDDPKERAAEEQCLSDVERYDVHLLHVHGDDEWPRFTYSVGLYRRFELPEVIILGLKQDLAHWIVNELAERARAGARFQVGDTLEGLLEGFAVTLRRVPPHHVESHFGWALWFYDGEPFPTAQVVFPSTRGVWPWDPGARRIFFARNRCSSLPRFPRGHASMANAFHRPMTMRSTLVTRAATLLCLALVPLRPCLSQKLRMVTVRSCPAADSLLGSPNDDEKGLVRGFYLAGRDSTILMSAFAPGAGHSFKVRFAGRRPTEPLSAQLLLLLPGDWRDSSLYPAAMPTVTATLDDSVHLDLTPAQVGQYPEHSSLTPVSAWVSADHLLAIARARVTHVRVANTDLLITPSGLRDLRAFYHVALCAEAPRE